MIRFSLKNVKEADMNKLKIAGIVLAVIVIAIFFFFPHGKDPAEILDSKKKDVFSSARPVRLYEVSEKNRNGNLSYPGEIRASKESDLSFRVGGPLSEVSAEPGDVVSAGDVLMKIDPRDFEDRIRSLNAQMAGAQANLDNAEADYKRAEKLFKDNVIPQSDYDHAKNAYSVSKAAVDALNASLQIAKHALEDSSLKAPFAGIVTKQYVENHEMVQPGQVVMSLHDISSLEVDVDIPENEIIRRPVKIGEKALVSFPAMSGCVFEAELTEWNSQADVRTRTYNLTFSFPAADDIQILPGMTVEVVRLQDESAYKSLFIPVRAVTSDSVGNSIVWVCNAGNAVSSRSVEVGNLQGKDMVEIHSGLEKGERVVVDGLDYLSEGMNVQIESFVTGGKKV